MSTSRALSHPILLLLCRLLLGTVFAVAAIPKISHPDSFATAIEAYEMLPLAVVNLAALVIPWIELICALFLIGGVFVRPGAALVGVLLGVFVIAISAAVLRDLNINCGCFGETGGATVGWNRVVEDLGLLIPVWLLVRRRGESPRPGDATAPGPAERAA
jgi:putative oxidoreductase